MGVSPSLIVHWGIAIVNWPCDVQNCASMILTTSAHRHGLQYKPCAWECDYGCSAVRILNCGSMTQQPLIHIHVISTKPRTREYSLTCPGFRGFHVISRCSVLPQPLTHVNVTDIYDKLRALSFQERSDRVMCSAPTPWSHNHWHTPT